jgi:two-component system, chemotaxis family, chemotaxis protein CheY
MTKTILTVDDSRVMRDLLLTALQRAGFDVVQADDGVSGLEALSTLTPDAIVTDINMPRMDGYELIGAVRRDPRLRATPILVLSTEYTAEKKMRARDAGATGWIVKPFQDDALIAAIQRVTA